MPNSLLQRGFVFGILVLFIGAGVTSSISGKNIGICNTLYLEPLIKENTDFQYVIKASLSSYNTTSYKLKEITLKPSDDSYIDGQNENGNFGDDYDLDINAFFNCRFTYIKFNLDNLPSDIKIVSATLEMYKSGEWPVAEGRIINCNMVLDSWSEDTITWNNKPTYSSVITTNAVVPFGWEWMEWNVTKDVKSFIEGSNDNFGWAFIDSDPCYETLGITLSSKEHPVSKEHPKLTIICSNPRNRLITNSIFISFFERFPNMEVLLRIMNLLR